MNCGKKAAAQIALLMAGGAMLCFGVCGYAENTMPEENELKLVFKDGELVKEQTFEEIRERLNGENHD